MVKLTIKNYVDYWQVKENFEMARFDESIFLACEFNCLVLLLVHVQLGKQDVVLVSADEVL